MNLGEGLSFFITLFTTGDAIKNYKKNDLKALLDITTGINSVTKTVVETGSQLLPRNQQAMKMVDIFIADDAIPQQIIAKLDMKKYDKAIYWYKKGISNNYAQSSLELGLLYKKAYKMGNIGAATSLGYLYDVDNHDFTNAIIWYKKAAKGGDLDGIKNLALLNRDNRKKIEGAAWYIALIDLKYPK